MYWELVKEFQKDPAQLERAQQRHYDKMPSDQMHRNMASDFKTDTFKAIGADVGAQGPPTVVAPPLLRHRAVCQFVVVQCVVCSV